MSLHIQMSEEAEAELRKSAMRNRISSLSASILLIVLGGLILFLTAVYIAKEVPAEFVAYVPTAENAPPTDRPVQQDLTSKAASPSSSVAPSVIVAVGAASPIAMAPVELDMASPDDFGVGSDIAMGFGSGGIGDGLGEGGSGLGEGKAGGSALTGTFYDLKQTARGASTGIRPPASVGAQVPNEDLPKVHEALRDFTRSWNASSLNKYYKSETKLYASNFYLPRCKAEYAPAAFQCKDKVKPAAWIAVYRGKVRAPKTGKFRFVGTGDDFIAVRFNNKQVLEAGWCIPSTFDRNEGNKTGTRGGAQTPHGRIYHQRIKEGKDPDHRDYVIAHYDGIPDWNSQLGGLTAGTPVDVKEGEVYSIEILVAECPGGAFGFVLLLDEYNEETKSWNFPGKKLDIFRTNFSEPDKKELEELLRKENCLMGGSMQCPPYNPDSLIWVAVP